MFGHRPLDESGPFTFVAADALTTKVRAAGQVITAVVLVATGANGDGHRGFVEAISANLPGATW